jgi:hypothetical protein
MRKLFAIAVTLSLGVMMAGGPAGAGPCANESRGAQRLEIESIIEDIALIHSLDPALLSAIARVESGECAAAVSPKGAAGLMQLMPATANAFGVEDPFDPVQNALGAARFIEYLKRNRPEGNLSLPEILAAYNAGEAAVTRAGGIPHYRETEEYVRRVLWLYLIGHVPQSQRIREAAPDPPQRSKTRARTPQINPARRFADHDSAILDQLAQLRRARELEVAGSAAGR